VRQVDARWPRNVLVSDLNKRSQINSKAISYNVSLVGCVYGYVSK
jgi:hypothetical protein